MHRNNNAIPAPIAADASIGSPISEDTVPVGANNIYVKQTAVMNMAGTAVITQFFPSFIRYTLQVHRVKMERVWLDHAK